MIWLPRCRAILAASCVFIGLSDAARAELPWTDVKPAPSIAVVAQSGDAPLADLVFDAKGRMLARSGAIPGTDTLVLVSSGQTTRYPIVAEAGGSPVQRISALAGGSGDTLWAVDAAAGKASVLRLQTGDNAATITARYQLDSAVRSGSRLTAITVDKARAYIADAGEPGIIILDLKTGAVKRVLDANQSLVPQRPVSVDGMILRDPRGLPIGREDTLLAVSPDGAWLFYQPVSGPLFRVETALLTDPDYSPIEQLEGVVQWRGTPSVTGMVMAPDGSLYMADIAEHAVLRFTPGRLPQRLTTDPRLDTPLSIAIGPDHAIYVATGSLDADATRQNDMPRWKGSGSIIRLIPPPLP
ncbi:L-dopachrome tautomerase-related protein [Tanticharoenia sakaeratensis]|uniref:Gluconolactonase n=1 Tax=Tanticharoenia sakaeratensis NBRC 103193 TaxID=1231623 RepID=A0A0D6MJU3_9PROT|nr:L-dopachrome tautomerase-related protein [Tanticharoenia sakaeratensis]GAN53934.1 hypothetical protein Tasa_012_110 [Tanticharoenia sakaeratensis NBRC 103193]GBQ25310.1 gluconolactonase [Tanticharoenia sakaeratensis NBRC 103193]